MPSKVGTGKLCEANFKDTLVLNIIHIQKKIIASEQGDVGQIFIVTLTFSNVQKYTRHFVLIFDVQANFRLIQTISASEVGTYNYRSQLPMRGYRSQDIQCAKPPKQGDQADNAHATRAPPPPYSGGRVWSIVLYVCRRAMAERCLASGGVRLRRAQ